MEIAKFRAARMLWADIVKQYAPKCLRTDCKNTGADGTCYCACKMVAHAETSNFNLTLFDAHVNLLRTQTEAMSAAIAGVNSITYLHSTKLIRHRTISLKELPATSSCC